MGLLYSGEDIDLPWPQCVALSGVLKVCVRAVPTSLAASVLPEVSTHASFLGGISWLGVLLFVASLGM